MYNKYMNLAIEEAKKALIKGEIPVGAIIVKDNIVIAKAHNTREETQSSLGHAEINAISLACKKINNWRLEECDMYVTMEPCPMCCGAILQARIKTYISEHTAGKNGCMGTVINLPKQLKNNSLTVYGGIMEDECTKLLTDFEYTGK